MKSIQYTETKYMLTVQEASRILGVSIHTVYRLISVGLLSAVKISSRKTVIKAEELERYISQHEQEVIPYHERSNCSKGNTYP